MKCCSHYISTAMNAALKFVYICNSYPHADSYQQYPHCFLEYSGQIDVYLIGNLFRP